MLNATITEIFHGLHEGEGAAIGLASLFLKVHRDGMLLVNVMGGPELHGDGPSHHEFRETAPNERSVLEHAVAAFFAEMTIFEHRRMSVEISNTCCLALHRLLESRRALT